MAFQRRQKFPPVRWVHNTLQPTHDSEQVISPQPQSISGSSIRTVDNTSYSPLSILWRRHQMETFSALLDFCAGNSPVPGEFPAQRPVTRSFEVFFDLRPNKRLSKQSWGWWSETPSSSLWRHRNVKAAGYDCVAVYLTLFIVISWVEASSKWASYPAII